MILKFPELMGGPVQGLNDAGVENFQGAIEHYLSRECGQNSGDAMRPDAGTVQLSFQRLAVSPDLIPGFTSLREALTASLARWGKKEKERAFFEAAIELASRQTIPVLKISDFGTTGLTGSDMDEAGRWFALVKSQGVSNKGSTAGGSFGIGKSSPFAASRFRTVFYGTRTVGGSVALQGVSRLVTHTNSDGMSTQGVGFIGDYDSAGSGGDGPVFRAVRDPDRIPAFFRRSEPGTDLWIIGYRSGALWDRELIRSILTNFWPAIYRGMIEFRVGEQSITKAYLAKFIEEYSQTDDFEADLFFKAIHSSPVKKHLESVGSCELYLTTAGDELPKKVCMARKSGMRIYDYQPRACRVPFSGLFICTDDHGNELLRTLEPPKHDAWDPKRTEDGSGKRALDEIKLWIREEIKALNPLFGGKSFNEVELAKYLPDSPDDIDAAPSGSLGGSSDDEGLEPHTLSGTFRPTVAEAKVSYSAPDGSKEGGVGVESDVGHPPHGAGQEGDSKNPGGDNSGKSRPPQLSVRSFSTGANQYEMILRSGEAFRGAVRLKAVGEDGTTEAVRLLSAVSPHPEGADLQVSEDTINDLALLPDIPLRLMVKLDEIGRRSLSAEVRR
jgi:hypothetical protein